MALKFRRGTTAQQSGSLAFGEPYVNTTLGTLLIGGPSGDIILSSTGTGSTGNFGAISGSGLDITGNANIAGNLTLGGTITIGDNSSDNVVVNADLSSSIIPNNDNSFDLGSTSFRYRAIHGTNIYGAINATNGIVSGSSQVTLQSTTGFTAYNTALATITGSLITSASNDAVSITNLNTFSGSALTRLTALEVETSNLETFSGSQLGKDATLATYTGSVDGKFTTIGTVTASYDGRFTSLATITGSLITSASNLTQRVGAIEAVSGTFARTNSTNTFNGTQTISGSLYVTQDLVVGGSSSIQNISSSNLIIGASHITLNTITPSSRFAGLTIIDSGSVGISGSFLYDAVEDEFVFVHKGNGTNVTSSHFILGPATYDNLGNETYLTTNKLPKASGLEHIIDSNITDTGTLITLGSNAFVNGTFYATGTILVSGSSQITYSGLSGIPAGIVSGSSQLTSILPAGVVSGSSQITAGSTTNFATDVKTQLNSNTVVSGSSQVIGILSSLNTYTGSNDTTNTTQTSRLDQLSTASGSAITRLTALEVETANLESFSSSALTRLTNLEGKDISITLTGDVTGTGTITDLANVSFATTIAANSVALGTDTTGDYVGTITGGTGVTSTGATSGEGISHTISIGQAVATSSNVQFNSLGIGMAASATAGRIDATNDIVAFSSSDIRFKENIKPIENALDKISKISGNTYDWKAENKIEHGYEGNDVGVIAQEIEAVLPQLVQTRDNGYKAVKYDKLVALLIQGMKEQQAQIEELKAKIGL